MDRESTRKCVKLLLLAFSVVLFPRYVQAQGQGVYGAITGVVTDASGAVVPNAKVSATSKERGVKTEVMSNESGHFTVGNLISGTYNVEVGMTGFKLFRQTNVTVDINTTVRIDVALEVGDLVQEVTVSGTAAVLQTEKVEVAGTISARTIESIPSPHNNATGLLKLLPGVLEFPNQSGLPGSSGNGQGYVSVSANGGRSQQNLTKLDGTINTEPIGGAANVVPPLDALEAVNASTSNYDVEFGQAQGVVMNMVTKSGTNQWHGSAYEYNRVNATSARNPFTEANGETSHFVWNQFGATVGGPIKKDKVFVFGGYQGVRINRGGAALLTVPTAAFRNGDFSAIANPVYDPETGNPDGTGRTQFTNNIIPQDRISPVAAALLARLPDPTLPGTDYNFAAPLGQSNKDDSMFVRGDVVVNDFNRFFARYTRNWQQGGCTDVSAYGVGGDAAPPLALPMCTQGIGSQDFFSGSYVHVFSPSLVTEARVGAMIYRWRGDPLDFDNASSADVGLQGLNDACAECGGLAGFRIGGPVGAFDMGNWDHAHQQDDEKNYEYVSISTWTRGAHSVKFGTDIILASDQRFDSASQGNYGCWNGGICAGNGFAQSITGASGVAGSGLSMASFLLGRSSAFQRIIYAAGVPRAEQKRDAFFIQDTWKVTPKLTLVLGLRYDYIGYPTSGIRGGISNFDFTNTNTIIANYGDVGPTAGVKNNWTDFSPRIGFAYRVTPNTVVRAGLARTFAIGFYGANFGAITNTWPSAARQNVTQVNGPYNPAITFTDQPPAFESGYDILAAAGDPGEFPTPSYSTGFGTDFDNPSNSIDQWNFSIQRQFGNSTTLSATYVGNAARHLFNRIDYNAVPPGPGLVADRTPYKDYGYFLPAYNQSNQSSSGYQGLSFFLEKKYSEGFSLTSAVTWSRSYDFGLHNPSYWWDSKLDRAPADDERALVISVGHVWDLPFGRGKRFLGSANSVANAVVSGWSFSGITRWMSGDAFTPMLGDNSSLNSPCCGLRPDRIGSGKISNPTDSQWFDPNAFTYPAQYEFGNSGRNILRGPAFYTADWGVAKDFKLSETVRFQFEWQIYNAFNHANLGNPNATVDSSTAGGIFSVRHGMRTQNFGLHLYW